MIHLLKTKLKEKDTTFSHFKVFPNANFTPLKKNSSFSPQWKAQATVAKDQLIICTIWSRGERYHFIFRGELAHTCTHPRRGSNTNFRIPPVSSNPPPPSHKPTHKPLYVYIHPHTLLTFTHTHKQLQKVSLDPFLDLLQFFLRDMSYHVTKSDSKCFTWVMFWFMSSL